MNLVTAIIVDDEEHNRNVLTTLLIKYCPNVKVIDEASNADEAFDKITTKKPHLIFLDIKMPNKSGFDLLKTFDIIDFEVIFVSAFDEFAITAFDFNALGYILKPIDYSKLIKTVEKAVYKIINSDHNHNISHFINTLEDKNDSINKISIHHNEKVVFLDISDITSVEANSGLCFLRTSKNERYTSAKDLKLFEAMLGNIGDFIRINKSVIINVKYLKSYSKGDVCIIEMINGDEFEVSRRKKTEVLSELRHI